LGSQVKYLEGELQEEALQLAIVNDDNSLLMLTANLPLAALLPRVHYNLKVCVLRLVCRCLRTHTNTLCSCSLLGLLRFCSHNMPNVTARQ
jgi:hypothetical protein